MRTGLGVAAAALSMLAARPALAAPVTDADRAFLVKDMQGARYELALAQAAQRRAASPPVRAYARMVARDHEEANAALGRLLTQEGVAAPPGMTEEDGRTLARLKTLNGAAFDKGYVDEVTRINAQDEADSDKEKSTTQAPRIRAFLRRFAAMDARHKQAGERLKARTG